MLEIRNQAVLYSEATVIGTVLTD